MVLGSTQKVIISCIILCYSPLEFIGSSFIDPDNYPLMLLQIVCGMYPNQKYGFSWPVDFSNPVTRVMVRSAYFTSVTDKLLSAKGVKEIYIVIVRISIHLLWDLSSGVIKMFLCVVSKPDIRIFFRIRLEEVRGEGAGWEFVLVMGMEEGR